MRSTSTRAAAVVLTVVLAGCGGAGATDAPTHPRKADRMSSGAAAATEASGRPSSERPLAPAPETDGTLLTRATGFGSRPPAWLGTRELTKTDSGFGEVQPTPPALRNRRWTLPDTVPMRPGRGFAAKVVSPAPTSVIARSSWQEGCPVAATELAWVRVTFWGFDARRHTGELLVNSAVADDVVGVFRTLYRQRFPQEQVEITRTYDPDAPVTGDGNGTGSFVCRPTTGATYFSQHAYGLAIDVNTFQNPYQKGDVVLPELAGSYLRRDVVKPGMIVEAGPVIAAFARIGWEWGGDWKLSLDYQHFSQNGL